MKIPTLPMVIILLFIRIFADPVVLGFSPPAAVRTGRRTRQSTALRQQAMEPFSERRRLLSHAFVATGLATLGAASAGPAAAAAGAPVLAAKEDNNNTKGSSAGSSNMQQPRNKQVGGLALKIRAVTRIMVRRKNAMNCSTTRFVASERISAD